MTKPKPISISALTKTLCLIAGVALTTMLYLVMAAYFGAEPKNAKEFSTLVSPLFSLLSIIGVIWAIHVQQSAFELQVDESRRSETPLLKCESCQVTERKAASVNCVITIKNCAGAAINPRITDRRSDQQIKDRCFPAIRSIEGFVSKDEPQSFEFILYKNEIPDSRRMNFQLGYMDTFGRSFLQEFFVDVQIGSANILSLSKPQEVDGLGPIAV